MAVTSPDGIWTPDSGDDYALTTDLAATADTMQAALTKRANYGVGTTAQMNAAVGGFPNGALWWNTTTNTEWRRVSGAWVNQGTGWVSLTLAGGVSGQLRVQRTRDLVEVQFSGSGPFPEGATQINSTSLAPQFCPSGNRRGGLGLSGSTDGSLGVSSSGTVFVIQATGASRAAADGSCLFHVG